MGFRLGIRIPPAGNANEVLAAFRRAEAIGFDDAVVPDSPLNYREAWSTISAAAMATERIRVGIAVTNPVSRHPVITASAARTLHEVSAGRFLLGLGTGDSAVGFDGMRPAKVGEMDTAVVAITSLLAGESVAYGDFDAALKGADRSPYDAPLVFVAASGPRMLDLGGRLADGVIILGGGVEQKITLVRTAAESVGRRPPVIHVFGMVAITDDIEAYARTMKPTCLRYAQLEGTALFDEAGIDVTIPDHTAGADGDVGHAFDMEAQSRALDEFISDEAAVHFVRHRTNVGNVGDIAQKIQHLSDLGCAGMLCADPDVSAIPHRLLDSIEPVIERIRP